MHTPRLALMNTNAVLGKVSIPLVVASAGNGDSKVITDLLIEVGDCVPAYYTVTVENASLLPLSRSDGERGEPRKAPYKIRYPDRDGDDITAAAVSPGGFSTRQRAADGTYPPQIRVEAKRPAHTDDALMVEIASGSPGLGLDVVAVTTMR